MQFSFKMSNLLQHESSLYLRQHADNPVNWHPWGEEAFALAKAEDKPVLVSIGYSSCHWCHVMAHESFEDEYIAGLMNRHFVCIKVDREERPDIDQIYMEAVQMITRQGGWPLHAFCLPDGRPFFGGTYFPPEDRGQGMVPWPQLLMRVADFYRKKRSELEENASAIVQNLTAMNRPAGQGSAMAGGLGQAAKAICQNHDDEFGGFGSAPKFPPSQQLTFLLEIRRDGDTDESRPDGVQAESERIDEVVRTTLEAMARGGIFDQIGGGFARYSVDRSWGIPHFEKMLYDNGLLLDLYARGWRRHRNPLFQAVAGETVEWAMRDMRGGNGLFSASMDADSGGEEGKFQVWNPAQVKAVLGEEEGQRFCAAYGITPEGNFEEGFSNPVLVAREFETRAGWQEARARLLGERGKRVQPATDEKQLVSWNSLFIRGLAEAAFSFNRADWFEAAVLAADAIWDRFRPGGRLRGLHHGRQSIPAFLDDSAFYAESLLALAAYADVFQERSQRFLGRAVATAESILEYHADPDEAGFFFTPHDHERLIARRKEWWDGATPAGNSALLHVFGSLHSITGEVRWLVEFNRLASVYDSIAAALPHGAGHALAGLAIQRHGIGVVRGGPEADWNGLADFLRSRPWQRIYLFLSEEPELRRQFQFCIGGTCRLSPEWEELIRPRDTLQG